MRLPVLPSVMSCWLTMGCGVGTSSGTLVACCPVRTEKDPDMAARVPPKLMVIVPCEPAHALRAYRLINVIKLSASSCWQAHA
jgi:hypothetical protein